MRLFVLACLLPVVIGGTLWLVLDEAPAPETAEPGGRQVATLVAVDSSGNGYDGIIQGAVELGLSGHDGSAAYSFERRGAWVQVPSAAGLNPGDSDFMVSAWVNLEEDPGRRESYDVIRKGLAYTVPGEFKLEVLRHGRVRCHLKDESQTATLVTNTEVTVTDGAWHWVACARTGSVWSALSDDTVTSLTADMGSVTNTVPLAVGSKYGMEDGPNGRVDDVRITVAEPPEPLVEVSSPGVAAALSALKEQPPTAWWRLDEATTRLSGD